VTQWRRRMAGACVLAAVVLSLSCAVNDDQGTVIPGTTTGQGMAIEFRSRTDPPASGENAVEVTVTKDGVPVTDATVVVTFSMPAMPSMNMPEMRSDTTLTHDAGGRYRGTGVLSMAGTWNVVVKVSRGPDELGSHRLNVIAK